MLTRSRQPALSNVSDQNINSVLHKIRIPQKAGSTRWPIVKTITATKPTVIA
jgi:hypothetical protein